MGNALKFSETNLFLIKVDYFYTLQELLYFANLRLNFLLCLDIVFVFLLRFSHILQSYTHVFA